VRERDCETFDPIMVDLVSASPYGLNSRGKTVAAVAGKKQKELKPQSANTNALASSPREREPRSVMDGAAISGAEQRVAKDERPTLPFLEVASDRTAEADI